MELSYRTCRERGVLLNTRGEQPLLEVREGAPLIAIKEMLRLYGRQLPVRRHTQESYEHALHQYFEADSLGDQGLMSEIDQQLDLEQAVVELPPVEELLASDDEAPVVRLINALFAEAVKRQASDIHLETYSDKMAVRMRVDGVMSEALSPPAALSSLLISRVKVMARLDIAEKRLPQDGRIALELAGKPIDVRVSTLPAEYGERIVMRLLDRQTGLRGLSDLGMNERQSDALQALLQQPDGIVLVTGPTGSGKTTTLYAALQLLNDKSRNILTVEDPIEYTIDGIGQTQINHKTDMTFARGLRSILRQDPDVVMVGEIRDQDTVSVAVQASLTGHLVLSTLHTNDALGAVGRLQNMGAEPWLLASTLRGVIAQRLVRKLCSHCATERALSQEQAAALGNPQLVGSSAKVAVGCQQCQGTGYRGRLGIYEMLLVDRQLRDLLIECASEAQIRSALSDRQNLQQCVAEQVLCGNTSFAEAQRCVRSELDHAL
ncbi:MAG: GspE/PulE family protein [Pseudomonadales bacterium]